MAIDYKRRKREEKHYMSMVPRTLPPAIDAWLDNVCLADHHYITYDRKLRYAFCSHCKQPLNISKWSKEDISKLRHLKSGECPRCGWSVTYLCMGRYKNTVMRNDSFLFLISQRTTEGLLFRRFEIMRSMQKIENRGSSVKYYWKEHQRLFNDGTKIVSYAQREVFSYMEGGWHGEWIPSKRREFASKCFMGGFSYYEEFEFVDNIEKAVSGSCFQYASDYKNIQLPANPRGSVLEKLSTWVQPLEYIERLGWDVLAQEIRNEKRKGINIRATTPEKMFHLQKQNLRWAAQNKLNLSEMVILRRLIREGRSLDMVSIRYLDQQEYELRMIKKLIPEIDIWVFVKRKSSSHELILYKDYLHFCIQIGYDLTDPAVLYPKNIKAAHDREMIRVKCAESEILDAAIGRRFTPDSKRFGHVDTTYMIRPPQNASEIIKEGSALNHCVGAYTQRVASKQTTILFLRKVSAPDKSLFTLEWQKNRLLQIRGRNNCPPDSEVAEFVAKWEARMKKTKTKKRKPSVMAAAI